MHMLYTGLDIHKKSTYGTMMDAEGNIVEQKEFENSRNGPERFFCSSPNSGRDSLLFIPGILMDGFNMGIPVIFSR